MRTNSILSWWRRLDSNQRRRKPTDLQSAPFSHSGTPPTHEPVTIAQAAGAALLESDAPTSRRGRRSATKWLPSAMKLRCKSLDGWRVRRTARAAPGAARGRRRTPAPWHPRAGRPAATRVAHRIWTISRCERLPTAVHVAAGAADLDRQRRVQQQHALARPGVELPDRGRLRSPGRSAASTSKTRAQRAPAGPARPRTPGRRPGPAVGYGSWPRMTTLTVVRRHRGAARETGRRARSAGRPRPPRRSRRTAVAAARASSPGSTAGPRRRQRRERRRAGRRPSCANRPASAAPGSGARMKASPTRKAWTPASRMRCTSARREDAAFGDQQAVGRHPRQQRQRGVERHLEGAQVAVVDADAAASSGAARARVRRRRAPRPAPPCRAPARCASRSAICASSRQAAISRMQSAPIARASNTW